MLSAVSMCAYFWFIAPLTFKHCLFSCLLAGCFALCQVVLFWVWVILGSSPAWFLNFAHYWISCRLWHSGWTRRFLVMFPPCRHSPFLQGWLCHLIVHIVLLPALHPLVFAIFNTRTCSWTSLPCVCCLSSISCSSSWALCTWALCSSCCLGVSSSCSWVSSSNVCYPRVSCLGCQQDLQSHWSISLMSCQSKKSLSPTCVYIVDSLVVIYIMLNINGAFTDDLSCLLLSL